MPRVAVVEAEEAHAPRPVRIEQTQSEDGHQCCKEGPPQSFVREVVRCLQERGMAGEHPNGRRGRGRGEGGGDEESNVYLITPNRDSR